MARYKYWIGVALVMLGAALITLHHHRTQSVDAENAIQVEAVTVKQASIPQHIDALGSLIANQQVKISPEISGQVSKVYFKDGQHVKKGEPLIRLDDAISVAELKAAKADLKLNQQKFKRIKLLSKKGMQPKQDYDQAFADLRDKQTNLEVKQAQVDKMTLRAPFDGVLGAGQVGVGGYVAAGESLVDIVDKQYLKVSYEVPEKFLPLLKLGQRITVTSSTFPGHYSGEVVYIAPYVDVDSRTVQVQALVNNQQEHLSPGLFVHVAQYFDTDKKSLLVPQQSLLPTIDGQLVYKIVDGKAVATKVTVGERNKGQVQIQSGLKLNDEIVSAGQQKLKDGSMVKITEKQKVS